MKNRWLALNSLVMSLIGLVSILGREPVASAGFFMAGATYWVAYYLSGR